MIGIFSFNKSIFFNCFNFGPINSSCQILIVLSADNVNNFVWSLFADTFKIAFLCELVYEFIKLNFNCSLSKILKIPSEHPF